MPDGTFPNAVNAFLLEIQDRNILIDTGYEKNFLPNWRGQGRLPWM
ncbi:MAG: hypothetical protein LUD15_03815 [Bacteroides sp.]|nr:hypothetical protein [Bacteroides sp.]